jgi:Fe-S-cluster-containing hydrogenase component 2
MIGCPVGSIRRRESLEVIIEDWCIGCEKCAKQCPYGNITIHNFDVSQLARVYEGQKVIELSPPSDTGAKRAVLKKATTCDLCSGLAEPSCVYACPHDAAIRVHPQEFFAGQLR